MTGPISDHDREYFEEEGVENVRIALASNMALAITDRGAAWRWLKEQDEAEAARKRDFDRRMFGVTIIGAVAAVVAAVASIVAIWPMK